MYIAYFDESESHKPAPRVYTVAGYVALAEKWKLFEKSWQGLLNKHNLPPFSMKNFANPHHTIYGAWSKEKKIRFLETLHTIIKNTYVKSFSVSLDWEAYDNLTDEEKYAFGRPYIFTSSTCFKHVGIWAKKQNINERITYIFEQGASEDKYLLRMWGEASEEQKHTFRIGAIGLGPKYLPPLQAADVLAYETRKEMCRQLSGERVMSRRSIVNLHLPKRDEWFYYNDKELGIEANSPEIFNVIGTVAFKIETTLAKKKGLI